MGRWRVRTITPLAGHTYFGEGVVAWHEINAVATGPIPGTLTFRLVLEGDRYLVKSIAIEEDGIGLTGEILRQIPLANLVRMAIEKATSPVHADEMNIKEEFGVVSWAKRRPKLPTGREGPSDDVLRFVAFAYRYAVLIGEPQIEFVREKLKGPSRATVARWINLARERGFWQPYKEM